MADEKSKIQGYLDRIEGLHVIGWAWDPENPEKRLEVVVYVDGEPVAEGVADLYREDLEKVGIGDGKYGFKVRLPNKVISEFPVEIYVRVKGANFITKKITHQISRGDDIVSEGEKKMLEEFDHQWFKKTYGISGISDKLTLFKIYKELVKTHKVSPNSKFCEKLYLFRYKDVAKAVEKGQFLCGFEHYVLIGRNEGRSGSVSSIDPSEFKNDLDLIFVFFDEEWYLNNYPEVEKELKEENLSPFQHYLKYVRKRQYSPNSSFDEKWYVSFYEEVKILIENNVYLSGFHHYLKIGKNAGFIPKRKASDIINLKFKGAIDPVGFERVKSLDYKLSNINTIINSGLSQRINFLVPTFDKDIMFGGYISLIEIIKKIIKLPVDIRFLICEDHHMNEDYFWYNFEDLIKIDSEEREKITFQNILKEPVIELHDKDFFFAYSSMTALTAYKLAKALYSDDKHPKVIYLIQEDERIFYSNNSFRALIDYVYSLPMVFLFNTKELHDYFKNYRIGPFRKTESKSKIFWFNCPITQVEKPSLNDLMNKKSKKLLFYTRPEAHAERNLFEMGIVALKKAINKGVFDESWSFHGIGSAKDYRIELSQGYILDIKEKMDLETYKKMLKDYDIGLFLMYAPHPGLVGFEMASAGMIVVVNSFDYRDEDYYKNKSKNFIVAEPYPDALADALKEAVIRASNYYERLQNIYTPEVKNWDEALPDEMIKEIFECVGVELHSE